MPEYELLELLLFRALSRGDVKPLAKRLIERFGSIGGVLGAEREALKNVEGVGDIVIHTLKLAQALNEKNVARDGDRRPVIGSWEAVVDYCTAQLAHRTAEHFRVLFLDSRNALIKDEEQQQGTVDHVVLYPREVIKRALELGASAVHPGAQPPLGRPRARPARRRRAHQGDREGRRHHGRDGARSPGDRPLPPRLAQGGGAAAGLGSVPRPRAVRRRRLPCASWATSIRPVAVQKPWMWPW